MTTQQEPAQSAPLSGLRLFELYRDGRLPSVGIAGLIGIQCPEVEEGRIVFTAKTRPDFANPLGALHGGIAATLLDSVLGCAVHTALPAGVGYSTLELKVNYIRAVATDGQTLTATGTVIHVGRRTATAEGRVLDEHGKLIAHATTTCIILQPAA